MEEDLCDQLFNHSEKRLARVLLKLAPLSEPDLVLDDKSPDMADPTFGSALYRRYGLKPYWEDAA